MCYDIGRSREVLLKDFVPAGLIYVQFNPGNNDTKYEFCQCLPSFSLIMNQHLSSSAHVNISCPAVVAEYSREDPYWHMVNHPGTNENEVRDFMTCFRRRHRPRCFRRRRHRRCRFGHHKASFF